MILLVFIIIFEEKNSALCYMLTLHCLRCKKNTIILQHGPLKILTTKTDANIQLIYSSIND